MIGIMKVNQLVTLFTKKPQEKYSKTPVFDEKEVGEKSMSEIKKLYEEAYELYYRLMRLWLKNNNHLSDKKRLEYLVRQAFRRCERRRVFLYGGQYVYVINSSQ